MAQQRSKRVVADIDIWKKIDVTLFGTATDFVPVRNREEALSLSKSLLEAGRPLLVQFKVGIPVTVVNLTDVFEHYALGYQKVAGIDGTELIPVTISYNEMIAYGVKIRSVNDEGEITQAFRVKQLDFQEKVMV